MTQGWMLAAMWPFDPAGLPEALVSYKALLLAPVVVVAGFMLAYHLVARRRPADTPLTTRELATLLGFGSGFAIVAWLTIAWALRPSKDYIAHLTTLVAEEADSRFVDALCAGSLERAAALSGRADLSRTANAAAAVKCVTKDEGPYGNTIHADPRRLAVLIDAFYPDDPKRRPTIDEDVEGRLVAALRFDRNQPGLDALRQRGVNVDAP